MTRHKSSGFVIKSFGVNTFEVWSNACVAFNQKKRQTMRLYLNTFKHYSGVTS